MTLLGNANWWFPRVLDRLVPDFSIEGEAWFRERERAQAAARGDAPPPVPVAAGAGRAEKSEPKPP
jgi:RND superfamily putative drug exporter